MVRVAGTAAAPVDVPTPGPLRRRLRAIAAVLCGAQVVTVLAAPAPVSADQRPKWELGIGSVFYTQPDYIGSDEYRFHALPFPWVIYRGPRLRLDRESISAKIFGTEMVRLDLSASGQISVDSDRNDRRRGMPDLDWIAQLGPTLRFALARSDDGRHTLDLDVPLRIAVAVDTDNVSYEGLVASPKFQYRFEPERWRFEVNAGLEFGNNDYNEYIYSVPARFSTETRPSYGAEGGYAGVRLAAGVGRYVGPIYLGVFARYFNLEGATFRDSPLVGSRSAFIGGIAVGWVWMKSKEMVPVGAEANPASRRAPASPTPQVVETTASPPRSAGELPAARPAAK